MAVDLHIQVIVLAVAAFAPKLAVGIQRFVNTHERSCAQLQRCRIVFDRPQRIRVAHDLRLHFFCWLQGACDKLSHASLIDVEPFYARRGVHVVEKRALSQRLQLVAMHALENLELPSIFVKTHIGVSDLPVEQIFRQMPVVKCPHDAILFSRKSVSA